MIKNLEKSLKDLENIVEELEKGELSLNEALNLFEKGVQLSTKCQTSLTEAEQKIEKITQNSSPQTEDR